MQKYLRLAEIHGTLKKSKRTTEQEENVKDFPEKGARRCRRKMTRKRDFTKKLYTS